jgi:hypothetical protein
MVWAHSWSSYATNKGAEHGNAMPRNGSPASSAGKEDGGSITAQPVLGEVQLAHFLLAPQQLLLAELRHPQHPRDDLDVDQGEQQLHILHCGRPGLVLQPFLLLEQLLHPCLLLQVSYIFELGGFKKEVSHKYVMPFIDDVTL